MYLYTDKKNTHHIFFSYDNGLVGHYRSKQMKMINNFIKKRELPPIQYETLCLEQFYNKIILEFNKYINDFKKICNLEFSSTDSLIIVINNFKKQAFQFEYVLKKLNGLDCILESSGLIQIKNHKLIIPTSLY